MYSFLLCLSLLFSACAVLPKNVGEIDYRVSVLVPPGVDDAVFQPVYRVAGYPVRKTAYTSVIHVYGRQELGELCSRLNATGVIIRCIEPDPR